MSGPGETLTLLSSTLSEKLSEKESFQSENIVPTGIQEQLIWAVAGVKGFKPSPRIVQAIMANKVGKTGFFIGGILKNIFWETDKEWFTYPIFNEWPYSRSGRIVGTHKNIQDDGPIRKEILKWWPKAKYKSWYKSKTYKSYYEVYGDNGFFDFDVMSFEQDKKEFEGPVKGWTFVDEPLPKKLLGAIFSRLYKKGLFFLGMTPFEAAIVLDAIEDFETKGARVNRCTATIWENSTTKGKKNSKGTKRGLVTEAEIADTITTTLPDEEDARLYGRVSGSAGRVYKVFDRAYHIRDIDLLSDFMIKSNHYMVMDPHRAYYPFCQWWAVLPNNLYYCYNEWPIWDTFKAYYDEVRKTKPCGLSIEDQADIFKVQDYTQLGYKIKQRWIDSRFAKGTMGDYTSKTLGVVASFADPPASLNFTLAPEEGISVQRDKLRNLLNHNKKLPMNQHNEPGIFWAPHCRNSIRAMERHHLVEGKEEEAETFKDSIDCTRMFLGGLGGKEYIAPEKGKKKKRVRDVEEEIIKDHLKELPGISLA